MVRNPTHQIPSPNYDFQTDMRAIVGSFSSEDMTKTWSSDLSCWGNWESINDEGLSVQFSMKFSAHSSLRSNGTQSLYLVAYMASL